MASSVGALLEEKLGNTSSGRSVKTSVESKSERSFWSLLATRARAVLLEDNISSQASPKETIDANMQKQEIFKKTTQVAKPSQATKPKRQETPVFQKGLKALVSSLSLIGDTLGSAFEEGFNLVETQASNLISADPSNSSKEKSSSLQRFDISSSYQQNQSNKKALVSELDSATQIKASRDVAMAMATKAKLLLRELKTVKADLTFSQDRCLQLEEENKRLRESLSKGVRPEEDDLVRLQLETLLNEKARLSQENAAYARENQFLHEVIEYHQLTTQDVALLDESIEEVAEKVAEKTTIDNAITSVI